jgi:hypothetical protein
LRYYGNIGEREIVMQTRAGFSCGPLYKLGFQNDYLQIRGVYYGWGDTQWFD